MFKMADTGTIYLTISGRPNLKKWPRNTSNPLYLWQNRINMPFGRDEVSICQK